MPFNYFDSAEGRLAERVDEAWADYQDGNISERKQALKFLIHVFDINKLSDDKDSLNKVLAELMARRAAKKTENPDYIPILHSGSYHFDESAKVLAPTALPKTSSDAEIQAAFDKGDLLDVIAEERSNDRIEQPTLLDSEKRANYNIMIYNGLFYKHGRVFDSSRSIAHNKLGYVAFTLNTNGELSVFEHLSGEVDLRGRKLVHSSMNSSAPVLVAGEMEIKNGQLISINNYSGHYCPSLYSIARFLEYLADRDMDLTKTKVLLLHKPLPESRLTSTAVFVPGSIKTWQCISAPDIIKSVNGVVDSNIATINAYLDSRKTKIKQNLFKVDASVKKVELLNDLKYELNYIKQLFKCTTSFLVLNESLGAIDSLVSHYQNMYREMRPRGTGRVGSLFDEMRKNIQHEQSAVGYEGEEQEQERLESFKHSPLGTN